jgi:hypothetical protein
MSMIMSFLHISYHPYFVFLHHQKSYGKKQTPSSGGGATTLRADKASATTPTC